MSAVNWARSRARNENANASSTGKIAGTNLRRIPPKPSDEYYTPPEIFEQLGLKCDIDVCAPSGGLDWIPAKRSFCIADDGLTQKWKGKIWMNPPYSQPAPWVERFTMHGNGICLVPVTKSKWFQALWESDGVFVLNQVRRKFIRFGKPQSILFATVFAALGAECQEAVRRLGRVR